MEVRVAITGLVAFAKDLGEEDKVMHAVEIRKSMGDMVLHVEFLCVLEVGMSAHQHLGMR